MSARRCAYVRCALPLPAGIRPNQLYCDSVCSARQRHRRARADVDDTTPFTLSAATVAQRGVGLRTVRAIRWTPAVGPQSSAGARAAHDAAMEAARESFARAMAAVPKRAGRPKGVRVGA